MQISTANLLASQSQPTRSRSSGDGFEPIAFKQAAPSAGSTAAEAQPVLPSARSSESTPAPTGYVRPGTNLDIKI